MNALLVYPRFPITYWGLQYGLRLIGKQASLPPLGLLTLAAQLPDRWRVRLVDLNVAPLDDTDLKWADVVLTGGMLIQVDSMHEIIAHAHAFKSPVAVGGPAPTTSPELFADADVVFRGEAEGRIDELVQALAQPHGSRSVLDAPASFPDMKLVPVPRYQLLDFSKYASMSMQYSRGCPFQCEFCDIVEIFGRKPRVKTPEQVIAEFEALHQLGYRGSLFVVDDNFIGNRVAVRQLLPVLREWQHWRHRPFELYTEASVDLASDPELLRDMVDSGFSSVFLGIETASTPALEQAKKTQNLRLDLSVAVDRITAAGLEVMGGFIVGFDGDGDDVFALQREFLARQPIPLAMVNMLTALPGTALWRRLEAEGRLRGRPNEDTFARPNFAPLMDEAELVDGYARLLGWLYSPAAYYRRCAAYLDRLGIRTEIRTATRGDVGALLRAIWHIGIVSPRRLHFWRLLARVSLRGRDQIRQAVVHAVQGEHLIRYTREFVLPRLTRALAEIQQAAALEALPRIPATLAPLRTLSSAGARAAP